MNEKVELNQFLSARAIRSLPGTWLIESEDYIIYISSMQISALIPKKAPFLCGGYWDDIAFAGALVEKNNKFLVLGAGIGSFLPLLGNLNPDIFINCVEINEEISSFGQSVQEIINLQLAQKTSWLITPAQELEDQVILGTDVVFIDIYTPEGLSEIALDKELHKKIKLNMNEKGLVFFNVFDQLWNVTSNSPTSFFISKLREMYPTVGLLRRSASSTIICSFKTQNDLIRRVSLAVESFSSSMISSYYKKIINSLSFPESQQDNSKDFDQDLLKFEEQVRVLNERVRIDSNDLENNLTKRAITEVANLTQLDIVKLSRRKDGTLGQVR